MTWSRTRSTQRVSCHPAAHGCHPARSVYLRESLILDGKHGTGLASSVATEGHSSAGGP
ncbi:hypothetical protein BVI434_30008 [Burkholderia vietnamiensis]|nr:hypothetical protein BVI434_30008 [Burkholderia vietnamiensis]